jgi:hypothetical protein
MDNCPVAGLPQFGQQSSDLPFGYLQLLGSLLLRNQLLLCFLQHHQSIAIALVHCENSFVFQLPSVTLSIGHF